MKITFLGTGADTAYPLPFCLCDYCRSARTFGGKNFRKRSSVVINKDLIIDLGPDIMSASFIHGMSIADVRYWLQTHPHADHFDPAHLSTRIPEYAGKNIPPIELVASSATINKMSEMLRGIGYINDLNDHKEQSRLSLSVTSIKPSQTLTLGNYEVSAFSTNHDISVESLLFSIKEENTTVFYGTDTDDLPEETWKAIHDKNLKFNIVILDHTYGPNINEGGHLNAKGFEKHIQLMRDMEMLKEDVQIYATHISHEGNPPHNELEKYGKIHGYRIAYDGLVIEV